jgi:hypothetical protein
MRKEVYSAEKVRMFFEKQKVATLPQIKKVLGTQSSMTVFRKLRELNYCSSISKSGKYYTLPEIAKFGEKGIWIWKGVLFSSYGTMREQIKNIIEESEDGCRAGEIEKLLKNKPNESLIELYTGQKVHREKIGGSYVYFSNNARIRRQQKNQREQKVRELARHKPRVLLNEVKAALVIFSSTLNEKQRRLYAGLESMRVGTGGDRLIGELLGINDKTVRRGRKELLDSTITIDTIRKVGGGRKKAVKKKSPTGRSDRETDGI